MNTPELQFRIQYREKGTRGKWGFYKAYGTLEMAQRAKQHLDVTDKYEYRIEYRELPPWKPVKM